MTNPMVESLEKRIEELKTKIGGIESQIEALGIRKAEYEKELAGKEEALKCVNQALVFEAGGCDELEEPDPKYRVYVDDEKIHFQGRGNPEAFWFGGRGYRFDTRLKMIGKVLDLLKEKDPERFKEFLSSDFSAFKRDGINKLSNYISSSLPEGEEGDWREYCQGLYLKRVGLREVTTMRIIEILLNYFGIDRHSFYVCFGKNAEMDDEGIDDEEFEEEDPDQLGLDL